MNARAANRQQGVLWFLKANLAVVVVANSTNALNYLYQCLMGRWLSQEQFGIANSLLSLTIIVSAFNTILQYVLARYLVQLAEDTPRLRGFLKTCRAATILSMTGALLLTLAATPWIRAYMRLDRVSPILYVAAIVATSVPFAFCLGAMSGYHLYVKSALSNLAASFFKIMAGATAVLALGMAANGVLFSTLVSMVVGSLIGFVFLKPCFPTKGETRPLNKETWREMGGFVAPVLLMTMLITVMGNVDLVLSRHYNTPDDAGLFAAAVIISRIGQFLSISLVAVLYPRIVSEVQKGESSLPSLLVVLGITFALAVGFLAFVCLFPRFVIMVFFGAKYIPATLLLKVATATAAVMALLNVMYNFLLAKKKYLFLLPNYLVLASLLVGVSLYWNDTPLKIAAAMLAAALAMALVTAAYTLWSFLAPLNAPRNLALASKS